MMQPLMTVGRRKMYNNYFSKWGAEFEKNRRRGKDPNNRPTISRNTARRTRPQVTRPSARPQAPMARVLLPLSPRAPDKYHTAEIVLSLTKHYVQGLLDIFTWDKFKIIPPQGVPDSSHLWQQISDQCYGATMLIKIGKIRDGLRRIGFICNELRTVVRFCDPAMMVKLWRICYRFHKTCSSLGNFQLFYEFLRYIRDLTQIYHGRNHPLFKLLDATIETPPDDLRGLVKAAYLRTITVMESCMGKENAVVLHMWSNYMHCENNPSPHSTTTIRRYEGLLLTTERQEGLLAETTISVLHGFMYFTYYTLTDLSRTTSIALKIHHRAQLLPCFQGTPQWCLTTQAFALATKLLATISLHNGNRQDCR
jgi:hypothetical protein